MINLENGLFEFQEKMIEFLIGKFINNDTKEKIIIKSPTGSGKTVMLVGFIDQYFNVVDGEKCFVWLCPGDGELEQQSKEKMEKLLPNRATSDIEEVLLRGFEEGETTFINWQKVTKKGNMAITDSERKNLYERIADAHRNGIKFILIIDEEHKNNTAKAKDVIDAFSAEHIVRVSATTKEDKLAEWYEVDEMEVINSGLITRALYINEGIDVATKYELSSEYEYLVQIANEKRKEIKEEYQKFNKNINPLVIIQFPNASELLIKHVEEKLESMGYNYKNKQVAIWLDNRKINIDEITKNDGIPKFLLMKQAISTGWDCPRAKVLVKLREKMNEEFEIQTLGRLRRMPEACHYENQILDYSYLYTFDEKYKDSVLQSGNAYEVKRVFRKEKCKEFVLMKETRDLDYDMLGDKEILIKVYEYFKEKYKLSADFKKNQQILEQHYFTFGTVLTEDVKQGKFVKTSDVLREDIGELSKLKFEVNTHSNGIDLLHAVGIIKNEIGVTTNTARAILKHLFHSGIRSAYKLLKLNNKEWYAFIINNIKLLKADFISLTALSNKQMTIKVSPKTSEFRIPIQEVYRYDSTETDVEEILSSAYEDYTSDIIVEGIRSKCERLFENYCEDNNNVEWIYKNGDKGSQYLSIVYTTSFSHQQLFYPDYIVKLKDGSIWIIETKGGEMNGKSKNIDKQVENKFKAFKEYATNYKINWAFVRDKNERLKYNNTEYTENLSTQNWKPIKDLF